VKGFGVCYHKTTGKFRDVHKRLVATGLLPKCTLSPVTPCIKSAREAKGKVIATLLVPANDPRVHCTPPLPVITTVSPISGLPNSTVTIKGLNFTGAKVLFGSLAATGTVTATKVVVKVPAGAAAGIVPITVTTPNGKTTYPTFKIT
jgi:hypothetical protein